MRSRPRILCVLQDGRVRFLNTAALAFARCFQLQALTSASGSLRWLVRKVCVVYPMFCCSAGAEKGTQPASEPGGSVRVALASACLVLVLLQVWKPQSAQRHAPPPCVSRDSTLCIQTHSPAGKSNGHICTLGCLEPLRGTHFPCFFLPEHELADRMSKIEKEKEKKKAEEVVRESSIQASFSRSTFPTQ